LDLITFKAIILGVLQGLTEFLPVSSSGHLVLVQHLFGIANPELFFNVILHLGTLTAILIVFRVDIKLLAVEIFCLPETLRSRGQIKTAFQNRPDFRLLILILMGSIPTGLVGIIFKSSFESFFASTLIVGLALLFTGLILFLTKLIKNPAREITQFGILQALAIGLAQGLAITPGISRSGITIGCALFFGLEKKLATRYSFLLSIPAILGALVIETGNLSNSVFGLFDLGLGFLAALLSGWLALLLLIKMIRSGHFYYFSYYCWLIGLIILWHTFYGFNS